VPGDWTSGGKRSLPRFQKTTGREPTSAEIKSKKNQVLNQRKKKKTSKKERRGLSTAVWRKTRGGTDTPNLRSKKKVFFRRGEEKSRPRGPRAHIKKEA